MFDLFKGFSYKVILSFGNNMFDGMYVFDRVDGMGCFFIEGISDKVVLICNYELYFKYLSV